MAIVKLGRFMSLEGEAGEEDIGLALPAEDVAEDGQPIDASETVESELVEAAPEELESAEAAEEADQLEETAESLESFLFAAQQASKNGGWTRAEADMAQLGIAAALRPIGYHSSAPQVISAESFAAGEGRKDLGRTVSVENAIVDLLKQIWEAIKKAVNKVIAYLRKWYLKIFDGASRLKKRAEAIKKKADNKGGTPTEKNIKYSIASLHISKKAPSYSDLETSLKTINGAVKGITSAQMEESFGKAADDLVEAVSDFADSGDSSKALTEAAKLHNRKDLEIGLAGTVKEAASRYPTRGGVTGSHELLGGRQFMQSFEKHEVLGMECGAPRADVIDFSDKKVEVDSDKEIKVLSPGEVVSLATEIIKGLEYIIEYKASWAKYEAKSKTLIAKMDSAVKKPIKGEGEDKENAKGAREAARLFGAVARSYPRSTASINGYAMQSYRAVLGYSAASLGQYKGN